MRELPRIVPRTQDPKPIECEPYGYAFMPCDNCGPVALILHTRKSTGEHFVTLASASALTSTATENGVDLSRLKYEDMCSVVLVGWPEDWGADHIGWSLIDAMAEAILGGVPWSVVAERVLAAHSRSKAHLN